MERTALCWWPVDGTPPPLSTDIEEIAIYMRLAHCAVASRDGRRAPQRPSS